MRATFGWATGYYGGYLSEKRIIEPITGEHKGAEVTVRAYVLVEAAIGQGSEVLDALREIPETVQADRVTGPYDVICVLELEDLARLGALIRQKIHPIRGITRTMSCVSFTRTGA